MARSKKKTLRPKPGAKLTAVRPGLGYSPAKETASAAGTHGGTPRAKNRRERRGVRQELKDGTW